MSMFTPLHNMPRAYSVTPSPSMAFPPSTRIRTPDNGYEAPSLYEPAESSRSEGVKGEQRIISALVGRLVNKVGLS